jgi:peptidoglycan/xylan/chitin deacetylase (PgdA/CDA1 family)
MRVALTYDDGPNTAVTPRLLDLLRREHVPATFFVVGEAVDRSPDLVRRMIRDGDAVGNHTYDHAHLEFADAARVRDELRRTDAALARAGATTRLVRTPYGRRNAVVAQTIAAEGRTLVLWSDAESHDWERPGDGAGIAADVVARVRDGSIVLLHDGDRGRVCRPPSCDRSAVVDATRRIVAALRARGYTFVTVDAYVDDR